jgi:peptidoglycan/xylan/chitin deacetylase (PgdA/CDA1 family)
MNKHCLLTNDVETTSIWFNALRKETGAKILQEGMPVLLDIYEKYAIKTTFFFTGNIARLYPQIVKMTFEKVHEFVSHSWSHEKKDGHDVTDFKTQKSFLADTKHLLEDISGQEVISFRSPALRINQYTAPALIEAGYKIDSSVPSQRFDFFLSFGSLKKFKWLFAPRLPYYTKPNDLTKKGEGPLIEVPLSAGLFPFVGTTMRIFPLLTRVQRNFHHWESAVNNKPVVFDIHPNEFIDESGEKRIIERRSSNYLSYLLQDLIRSQLKVKNLGPQAVPLYDDQIKFFYKRNYKFTTIKGYCEDKGFL